VTKSRPRNKRPLFARASAQVFRGTNARVFVKRRRIRPSLDSGHGSSIQIRASRAFARVLIGRPVALSPAAIKRENNGNYGRLPFLSPRHPRTRCRLRRTRNNVWTSRASDWSRKIARTFTAPFPRDTVADTVRDARVGLTGREFERSSFHSDRWAGGRGETRARHYRSGNV